MATIASLSDPIVVAFPLHGEWVAVHTPAHRVPSHGTDLFAQTYAYDLWRTDPERKDAFYRSSGLRYWTRGVSLDDCYGYREPVHAVFDGTVVHVSDIVPDRRHLHPIVDLIKVLRAAVAYSFLGRTDPWTFIGNHVLLRSVARDDVFALSAHLAQGSVRVHLGDLVLAGDHIGQVGHTGNSTAPHLHFQLMNGPDPATATGLAVAFRAYEEQDGDVWRFVEGGIPPRDRRIRSV